MKRVILLLVAVGVIAGCATTAKYEKNLDPKSVDPKTLNPKTVDSWMGSHVDTLVSSCGPPQRSVRLSDGSTVLEYTNSRDVQTGGTSATFVQKTTFTADSNGIIAQWSYEGRPTNIVHSGGAVPESPKTDLPEDLMRRKIFYDLLAAQDRGVGSIKAQEMIADQYRIKGDIVQKIVIEGKANGWCFTPPIRPKQRGRPLSKPTKISDALGAVPESPKTDLPEDLRRKIFYDLIAARDRGVGSFEAYEIIADQYRIKDNIVRKIVKEGKAKDWPRPSTGWVLIVPPPDGTFGKHFLALLSFTADPSDEEKRAEYMSKVPPEEFEQIRVFFKRIAEEPSSKKRYIILVDSTVDKKAPVGQWEHVKAFDSAKACEDVRSQAIMGIRELEKAGAKRTLSWARILGCRCEPASSYVRK